MKETAVQWFFDELYSIRKTIPFEDQADAILKAFAQAKEIEKEQLRKAYLADPYNAIYGFQQYYNKTFKSE